MFIYIADRPKGRDKKALVLDHVVANAISGPFTAANPGNSTPSLPFEVDVLVYASLENRTDHDITLPADITAMVESKENKALYSIASQSDKDSSFLPAHHIAQYRIALLNLCPSQTKADAPAVKQCFEERLKSRDLILFDKEGIYEIRIPLPDTVNVVN
jgi:hypothetical protein